MSAKELMCAFTLSSHGQHFCTLDHENNETLGMEEMTDVLSTIGVQNICQTIVLISTFNLVFTT